MIWICLQKKKRRLPKILFEWSRIGKRRRVRKRMTWGSFIQETTKINYEVFRAKTDEVGNKYRITIFIEETYCFLETSEEEKNL